MFDFTTLNIGDVVKDKEGCEFFIICTNKPGTYPVVAYNKGNNHDVNTYTSSGRILADRNNTLDLVPPKVTHKGYVIILKDRTIFTEVELARHFATPLTAEAIIYIEYEVGEGLGTSPDSATAK